MVEMLVYQDQHWILTPDLTYSIVGVAWV